MKKIAVTMIAALLTCTACAAEMNEEQKTLYAVGLALGRQAAVFNFTPAELEYVKKGLADSVPGAKPVVELDAYGPKIERLVQTRQNAAAEKAAAAGKTFAENAAKEKGAIKTESGLVYLSTKEGTGASPKLTDTVEVHYKGSLTDGTEFDSSYKRGQPAQFPLNGVIKCWGEGVQKMKVGGKARLTCPPAIAYGEAGAGGAIPPNATLSFEVELLRIIKEETKPAAPAPAARKKK